MMDWGLFQNRFSAGNMNREQATVWRVGTVLGTAAQPYQIPFAVVGSVVIDELTFENEKLFISIVCMGSGAQTCWHAVDMKSNA